MTAKKLSFQELLMKKIDFEISENERKGKEFGKKILSETDETKVEMLKSIITLTNDIQVILEDAKHKIICYRVEHVLEILANFLIGKGYNYYYDYYSQKTEKFSGDTKIVGYGISENNDLIIGFNTNGKRIHLPLEFLGRENKEGEGEEFHWRDFFEHLSLDN